MVQRSLLSENPVSLRADLIPSEMNVGGGGESAADGEPDHRFACDFCADHVNLSALLRVHQQTFRVLVGSLQFIVVNHRRTYFCRKKYL